jgi:hypothetical protein
MKAFELFLEGLGFEGLAIDVLTVVYSYDKVIALAMAEDLKSSERKS